MLKTVMLCSILALAAVPVLAQTPAHRAANAVLHNQQTAPARPSAPASLAADQFSSEQAAKSHCPGDTVVWANLGGSKAYHMSGNKYYGKTKQGAFMCQKEADQSGFHSAGRRAGATAAKGTGTTKTTK